VPLERAAENLNVKRNRLNFLTIACHGNVDSSMRRKGGIHVEKYVYGLYLISYRIGNLPISCSSNCFSHKSSCSWLSFNHKLQMFKTFSLFRVEPEGITVVQARKHIYRKYSIYQEFYDPYSLRRFLPTGHDLLLDHGQNSVQYY